MELSTLSSKDFNTDDLLVVDPDEQIRLAIEREMLKDHQQQHNQDQREMEQSIWRMFHWFCISTLHLDCNKVLLAFGIDHENIEAPEETPQVVQTPNHAEITEALMLHADIPSFDELTNTKPQHLRCLNDDQKYEPKSRKREVNYFTPHMQQVDGEEPVNPEEAILSVSFYHPQKNVKTQEYLVLGSQCLTELKDKIYCLSDEVFAETTSKSGFFFIEKTFYDDTRSHDAIIYSRNILEWVNSNNRFSEPGLGIYCSKKMEDTTFEDLSLRIGMPYLYCHRGNCEHIMVFTDVRLMHNLDNHNKRAYPLQTFQNKIRKKKCRVCDIYPARWVTIDDKLAPENPCFFCEQCYKPLHYKQDGTLLYNDFKVFRYHHE